MPEDSLKSWISAEIFHLSIPDADPKLLESMFIKATSEVQQSIIEDLLRHFATIDEYDAFLKLLETKIIEPKLFPNGETLFTNLLKEKNVKYCLAIIHHAVNRKFCNLGNVLNEMPLQIAIETELYDFMCPLIFQCDQLNNENINWNTALMQLFQKLSISTDVSTDDKLMTAVMTIISRGGNIYKETSTGIRIIEFCSRLPLRNEIEAFGNIERNRYYQVIGGPVSKYVFYKFLYFSNSTFQFQICSVCLDRELDCALECGHTFCEPCVIKLSRCPMCNAEPTNPRKLYIN